jgi:hypothetical protein
MMTLARMMTFQACLVMSAFLAGCGSSGTSPQSTPQTKSSAPEPKAAPVADIKQKLTKSSSLLMETLQKPTAAYHFTYSAQENINTKYPRDTTAKPEVGPVALDIDLTPDQLNMSSVRGKEKKNQKIAKSDQLNWAMANLELIGPVTSTGMMLAFGQLVAQPSGSESAGGVDADKYTFDTSTASGTVKTGMDIAKSMITNIDNTKGTVWLDKATGTLVKFNIDADFADKNSNAWKEHYEGELTKK